MVTSSTAGVQNQIHQRAFDTNLVMVILSENLVHRLQPEHIN